MTSIAPSNTPANDLDELLKALAERNNKPSPSLMQTPHEEGDLGHKITSADDFEKFQGFSDACLRLTDRPLSSKDKLLLLNMAQTWKRLAASVRKAERRIGAASLR
jgi:hypothetical protein